jgi:DNA sulfur modification protein DndE
MKPPVEHVRISAKNKDALLRIKKRTGLEHWNEICRIAYCRSIANPDPPVVSNELCNTAIDIEWKTFAGMYHDELISLTLIRAKKDGIETKNREALANYFRAHLDRGISSLQSIKNIYEMLPTYRP